MPGSNGLLRIEVVISDYSTFKFALLLPLINASEDHKLAQSFHDGGILLARSLTENLVRCNLLSKSQPLTQGCDSKVAIAMSHAPEDVTAMLLQWGQGDRDALDRLVPVVYDELHRIAERCFRREGSNNTLQPTALVNELYVRLVKQSGISWQNRAQFFGIAATTMRRILVERARARKASKRGSGNYKLDLTDVSDVSAGSSQIDLLALDRALEQLATFDPQQCRIVEAKFFGGLSIEETAEVIGVSPATVKREWSLAKAWLFRELS